LLSDNDVVSLLLDLIVTESERAQGKRRWSQAHVTWLQNEQSPHFYSM